LTESKRAVTLSSRADDYQRLCSADPLLVDLQAAIKRFPAETDDNPRPFAWTADADKSSLPSHAGTKR
jgi:hypothetical protein